MYNHLLGVSIIFFFRLLNQVMPSFMEHYGFLFLFVIWGRIWSGIRRNW